MEIWNYPNRYRPARGSFRTYIGLLARSRARDSVRQTATEKENRRRLALELGANTEILQQKLDPSKQVAEAELREKVRETFQALPAESVALLTMCFYDGLSHREIAESLDLPIGTVKSRIRRALKSLANRMRSLSDTWTGT